MTSVVTKRLLTAWLRRAGMITSKGFTLLELLIAIFIGSIITTTLLYLVVEMLEANAREEALTQTQQDMRRAVDFITRDISEAVYVYDNPEVVVDTASGATLIDQLTDLPAGTPILAFWRVDPLSNDEITTLQGTSCDSLPETDPEDPDGNLREECRTLKVRQATYTLVVYLHQANDPAADDIWSGESRIVRYQLPKYEDLPTFDKRDGYRDPANTRDYEEWQNLGNTAGDPQVLVDQVAAANNEDNTDTGSCPSDDPDAYTAFPETSDSFYVCIRNREAGSRDTNQSLAAYLQGRPEGFGTRPIFSPASENSQLPRVRSEVIIRGVVGEDPQEN